MPSPSLAYIYMGSINIYIYHFWLFLCIKLSVYTILDMFQGIILHNF